jgi:DNA-binding MarR family transcriptional regulator
MTNSRLERLPSWQLAQASARAHGLLGERLAAAGARRYHYRLLAALDELGPASQAALGKQAVLDRSDVAETVDELAAAGYVTRSPDPDDRRRNVIALTASGAAHLEHLDAVVAAVQDELLRDLSSRERATFVRLLRRIG